MSLVFSRNGIKMFDMRNKIDIQKLKSDFKLLRDGVGICRYDSKLRVQPIAPVYQKNKLPKAYPRYEPKHRTVVKACVSTFVDSVETHKNNVLLIAQRVTHTGGKVVPTMEKGPKHVGLFCIARENINGGISEFHFMKSDHVNTDYLACELQPGYMVVWNTDDVEHEVGPMFPANPSFHAYMDAFVLYAPDNSLSH
jgi:hypothetical protein